MTLSPVQQLQTRPQERRLTIALSEGEDRRVVAAALSAVKQNLANIILIGDLATIQAEMTRQNAIFCDQITLIDPATSDLQDSLAQSFFELRKHKGISLDLARDKLRNRMFFAAMLVREGHADGTVGGAVTATGDVILPALQVIGKAPDADLVSSFFMMLPPNDGTENGRAMLYSDCGFVVDPNSEQLAAIALSTERSAQALLAEPSRIAMLSFSTFGSAKHALVSKVAEATDLLRQNHPDLLVDGEMQFDAAFNPSTAARKAPDSEVAGVANVMIFPSLDAGNIAYKITERIGGYTAIGPILQGLAKPANDLSRGCSADDIVEIIAVTVLQALAGEAA